ncbi:MAG TPA: orotidine 5'-phosphate decarboxylase / HUMPS family protein, partial [Usitatibacter sp.]
VIGVTILTSLADADLARVGFEGNVIRNVERLARLSLACGLDGVVCSAQEAAIVRKATNPEFVLVTPGIRLASDAVQDQARVVTPIDAIRNGANYLVIGRSITGAPDPIAKLTQIRESLEGAPA